MTTFRQLVGHCIIRLYPKRRIGRVRIVFTDLSVEKSECIARLRSAIAMCSAGGSRYQRLVERIRYVVVWSGDRVFADDAGGIHVPSADLLGIGELALAALLIHEAVHLRVFKCGISYRPDFRERIERLCIREQAQFLRHSGPAGEEMALEAEAALDLPWWTDDMRELQLQRTLQTHNLPRWLMPILRR